MNRPRIRIEISQTDWTLEMIGALGIILTFLSIFLNYNDLPEMIPRYFNGYGKPDGYSNKELIWTLPIITLIVYRLLTLAPRYPHIVNYPIQITVENAERQYKNLIRMIRVLKTMIAFIFFYLTYMTIQNGLGKMHGLGVLFLPALLMLIFGTMGVFIYRGYKLR